MSAFTNRGPQLLLCDPHHYPAFATMSSQTFDILAAFPAPPAFIDFTIGLDWLTAEEKKRFQLEAERSYRRAALLNNKSKTVAKVKKSKVRPSEYAPKVRKAVPPTFETEKDIPQVCRGVRLISLDEARSISRIKYHGVLNF